jgi:WD40-like Beta Propeller Repeat
MAPSASSLESVMKPGTSRTCWTVALATAAILSTSNLEAAFLTLATAKLVTNTTGGLNQNPSIDKSGNLIAFTSNTDHEHPSGTVFAPPAAFDFDGAGNGFTPAGAADPNPSCQNCAPGNTTAGNLYLWRARKKGADPANSFRQLTFSTTGGFTANQEPDLNQRGTFVAWDSDRDHVGANADGNREIFLLELKTGAITQVTHTTSSGDTANRRASLSDDGKLLVFESTRDFSGASCTLTDLVSPCDNADGNSEVMLYRRLTGDFVQVTKTTGGTTSANPRPRISNDGRYVAWQSTRDFGAQLPPAATCTLLDGVTACDNADGNSEVMRVDLKKNAFTQLTKTTPAPGCSGTGANERVEISTRGNYVSFQSTCEFQLNPGGCGSCDGSDNDEVFVADFRKKALQQATISAAGYNRVPRISGNGTYIAFESTRSYKTQNPGHQRALYLLRRSSGKPPAGKTGPGQLIEDAGSPLLQNEKTQLTGTAIAGGFNTSAEHFGVSFNGRFVAFDNQKLVGNQEVWRVDGRK